MLQNANVGYETTIHTLRECILDLENNLQEQTRIQQWYKKLYELQHQRNKDLQTQNTRLTSSINILVSKLESLKNLAMYPSIKGEIDKTIIEARQTSSGVLRA